MTEPSAGSLPSDGITISFTKQQTPEVPVFFEIRVQVDLGGHRVAWDIKMVPEMVVPIEFDGTQKLIIMMKEGELLIDSSRVDRTFSLVVQESDLDGGE